MIQTRSMYFISISYLLWFPNRCFNGNKHIHKYLNKVFILQVQYIYLDGFDGYTYKMWNMKMTDFLDHISQVDRCTDYVITTLIPHSSRTWRCKRSNISVLKSSQRVVLATVLKWIGVLGKFWNFIRLWRQRRWFAAWKYKILTFTDRCCSDATRNREAFRRKWCSC